MKKLTDRVEKIPVLSLFLNREFFTLCYLTVCLLLSFPFLINIVSPVAKACFLWGVGLIGWDLLTKRRLFRSPFWLMPLLILGAYALSVLLNRQVLVTGLKHWLHLAISLLLIYAADRDADGGDLLRTAKRGFVIVNLVTFIGSLISLVLFALQTQVMIDRGAERYKQGFYENRLYGVYASPNPGALLALIAVAGVVFLFLLDGKKLKCKWFFIANTAVQKVYFSLTLSKGGLLSAAAAAAVVMAFVAVPRIARNRSVVKTALISLLVCAVAAAAAEGVMTGIRFGMSYVPGLIAGQGEDGEDRILIERVEQGDETSAIRVTIWQGGLKLVRSAPLFGVADADVDEADASPRFDLSRFTEEEETLLYKHNGYFHNIAVQILVYSGVAGVLLFLLFALLIFVKILKTLLTTKPGTPGYHAVAVLTALCAALAVNGVSEAHLVYHRQDPIGLIFWMYLGLTLLLADRYRKSPEGVKNGGEDRIALLASTPYQVLNCLSFVQSDAQGSRGHTDLYVAHPFRDSEQVSEKLKACGVFNHVYDLDAFEKYDSLKGKLTTFFRLFLPEPALKAMARGKLPVKGYSAVAASSQTSASIALRRTYPQAASLMYDDGVGSYYGNMARDYNSAAFNLLNAVFFNGGLNLSPEKLFLTNPAMSQSESEAAVVPLAPVTGESAALAEEIFSYRPNDAYRGKVIYLTQPMEESVGYAPEREDEVVRLVGECCGGRVVGRVHPRQKIDALGEIPLCDVPNLWELECVRQLDDDNVLIGGFSTAQLTPKMLCGKEPTVIFTYKLLVPHPGPAAEKIFRLIGAFRSSYRHPERVHLPETPEELEAILRSL